MKVSKWIYHNYGDNMLLEQRILDLQKDKVALIDKVRELKEVIYEKSNL